MGPPAAQKAEAGACGVLPVEVAGPRRNLAHIDDLLGLFS